MTSFIALPDVHDHATDLRPMRFLFGEVDAVLLPGDMTNGGIVNLQALLSIIEPVNENILAVCGNMDTEQINMALASEGLSLHRRHQMQDGIAILGCGGALPFAGRYVFSEEELAAFLEDSLQGVPEDAPKILVCHQPPYGACDTARGNRVGSHAVRAFIERVQPLIAFTGHIHEDVGIENIGKTRVINSGPFWRSGKYA
ncbi:MAG: metallophosphoesterase family protein [Anaerolineae bacterium]|nr:metallophosphoesterase family protein [Anaerolineae bacterium]